MENFFKVPEDIEERKNKFKEDYCLRCDNFSLEKILKGSCKEYFPDNLGMCWNYSKVIFNDGRHGNRLENKALKQNPHLIDKTSNKKYPITTDVFTIGRINCDNTIEYDWLCKEAIPTTYAKIIYKKNKFHIEVLSDLGAIVNKKIIRRNKRKKLKNKSLIKLCFFNDLEFRLK